MMIFDLSRTEIECVYVFFFVCVVVVNFFLSLLLLTIEYRESNDYLVTKEGSAGVLRSGTLRLISG